MNAKSKRAHQIPLLLRNGSRANLSGSLRAALVFGNVIKIMSLGGHDLNGTEGLAVKDRHRQLPTADFPLHNDPVAITQYIFQSSLEFFS